MANTQALQAALADFATRLTDPYDLDEVLHDVGDRAVEVLGLAGAGLTIGPNPSAGEMSFVTATDAVTEGVEQVQDRLRDGVCYEAARRGEPLMVSALAATDRWPRYTKAALEAGFNSVAGIPLRTEGDMIGVLSAYRHNAGPWSAEDIAAGDLLARMATTYLANATRLGEARKLAAQLQLALDSRVLIEQAKGALAERLNVTTDMAFQLLRAYARSNRRQLRNVAQEVLAGELNIGDQNEPDPRRSLRHPSEPGG
jgi:GAF domain-containing protein